MMEKCYNYVSATVGVCPQQWGISTTVGVCPQCSVGVCLQQWGYVQNSGGMSGTVMVCPQQMLYQFIVTMNKSVVKQMYLSLFEYWHALNA